MEDGRGGTVRERKSRRGRKGEGRLLKKRIRKQKPKNKIEKKIKAGRGDTMINRKEEEQERKDRRREAAKEENKENKETRLRNTRIKRETEKGFERRKKQEGKKEWCRREGW